MYNKNIKIVLATVFFALVVWQFVEGNIGNGIFFLLIGLFFLLLYFRNEFLLLSFMELKKQDLDKASKWLTYIKEPQKALTQSQYAYYHYLKGVIHPNQNLSISEKHLKQAIKLGLRMDQDVAIAKLNLAGIAINKRKKREAQTLLTEAKKLDKNGILKEQIQNLKQQMKRV